ncbi:MAG: VWA domain-containing protein, partial [Pirellulales bacterium]|nr:VWA domain-containing protein [Pirellulales bacterium]
MSNHVSIHRGPWPVAMVLVLLVAASAIGAETTPEAARLDRYTAGDGTSYFALSLKPTSEVAQPAACDVVILVDTSTSQTGEFRDKEFEALKGVLANLRPEDRVKLVAMDLKAIPLQKNFAAPGSDEVKEALAKLDARAPAGATDLENGLRHAAASFEGKGRARAVVYLGDGMSPAKLITPKEFVALGDKLAQARIAVSSFVLGPRVDLALPGGLAGRTGGVMILPDDKSSATQLGGKLGVAAHGTVYWPTRSALPADRLSEVYPKEVPPLRTDRDSVLIGTMKGDGPVQVSVTAETAAGPKELNWSVQPSPAKTKEYLVKLVDLARRDGAATLGLVDSSSLRMAQNLNAIGAANFRDLAAEALAMGNTARAKQLAEEVIRRKAGDPQTLAILREVERREKGGPVAAPGDLNLVGKAPAENGEAVEGAFAQAVSDQRKVLAEMVSKDVEVALKEEQKRMAIQPGVAIQNLKVQLENVRRVPDLNPDVRDQLIDQIQSALQLASRRQETDEQRRQAEAERQSALDEKRAIAQGLAREHEKLDQLMKRMHSLMQEGRYRRSNYLLAEEEVIVEAQDIAGQDNIKAAEPSIAAAARFVRYAREFNENQQLRVLRQRMMVACLGSVEQSHVPFNDNVPIVYPDPEVWSRMSKIRKDRYSNYDLAIRDEAESKIIKELNKPTQIEYLETPLEEVLRYIGKFHNDIIILLDKKTMEDLGIAPDHLITVDLKGIQLRAALKLMLKDLGLTYVIHNQVLLITSVDAANKPPYLDHRVYPVADLIVPINSFPGGGMGMMGGMGGMGGMMG